MRPDSFADLRRLADWFATSPQRTSVQIDRIVARLGATAVPLLGRELRVRDARRRDAARAQLAQLAQVTTTTTATGARARVVDELRRTLEAPVDDDTKVTTLGLLAELGERSVARFEDPLAIQRRSAIALAAHLDSAAEVASAADLMVRQLSPDDIVAMVEVMARAAREPARRLADELAGRLDLASETRNRIASNDALVMPTTAADAPAHATSGSATRRSQRPTHVAVLVDAAARLVVVASRKVLGERRFRRWAVLIDASGVIGDCVYEDAADGDDAAPLIANLCADGYRVASSDHEHARGIVIAAARRTAARLPSPYYLGRDLLDLDDAHLGNRAATRPNALARAVELLAEGQPARARTLLALDGDPATHATAATAATIERASADLAATTAACLLADAQPAAALPWLERAVAAEPAWPLHHWNLAAAAHLLGDSHACYRALTRFAATSSAPTALLGHPDQAARIATA